MKGLVVSRPGELELRELPVPEPGPFEALVRIEACGICSTTDAEILRGKQPFHSQYPCLLGHEAVGTVVEKGRGVTSFQIGDRVSRPAGIWPGGSRDGIASGWGGFAEMGIVRDVAAALREGAADWTGDYAAMRQQKIHPDLPLPAAVLSISLSETASWANHLPGVGGRRVVVSGTGIAGLSIALWCKLARADKVVVLGRRKSRLELARRLGADEGINVASTARLAEAVKEACGGGADLFIEAVGKPEQVSLGLGLIRPGGMVAVYGVPEGHRHSLEWLKGPGHASVCLFPAEEHLARSWVESALRNNWVPWRELMTHEFGIADFRRAFQAVADGEAVKAMLLFKNET